MLDIFDDHYDDYTTEKERGYWHNHIQETMYENRFFSKEWSPCQHILFQRRRHL